MGGNNMRYLAIDIGNSSGRGMIAEISGHQIKLQEVYRFTHELPLVNGRLQTDILYLFSQIRQTILASKNAGLLPDGIGIDTWGVDFGLLDSSGELLGNPYNCRDPKNQELMDGIFDVMDKDSIYAHTGIAFQPFNTLNQLHVMQKLRPWILENADSILTLPDLLGYMLTGEKKTDYTNASTYQLMNVYSRDWDDEIIRNYGFPRRIFGQPEMPPKLLGHLCDAICDDLKLPPIPVYMVAGHDTASAVAAMPEDGSDYAYISSGSWSLMGFESHVPYTGHDMIEGNFTNEGGVNNTYRVLRNIMGLWILQECRREWNMNGRSLSFSDLNDLSSHAEGLVSFIQVDSPEFLLKGSMIEKVQNYCSRTGQKVPETPGEVTRCIQESLAMRYRWTLDRLDRIRGIRHSHLRVVGGGSQDRLLSQFTANAIGRHVKTGPVEATALGNACLQAIACGQFKDVSEARTAISESFPQEVFEPEDQEVWNKAYKRWLCVTEECE